MLMCPFDEILGISLIVGLFAWIKKKVGKKKKEKSCCNSGGRPKADR
ncbi:hypothetical protein ACFLZ0_00740 [Patescibacteria group bacterium]